VFVPLRIDDQGICDGITTEWRGEKAAIRAAKIAAKERLEEMSSEDLALKRFRVFDEADASTNRVHELRDLA
jgi:hypothetical protein